MTTDVDARLRADGAHWRQAERSVAPPWDTAFAAVAATPVLDEHIGAAPVLQLTSARPSHRESTHRRRIWAGVATAVVVLAGAGAGVLGITRHDSSPPAAAAGLGGTNWVAPGAGTLGYGTTLTFDSAVKKLTVSDGCDTSPSHVTVGRGTLRIGGPDGLGIACSPAAREPVAGDPSVAAQNALDTVLLPGTVSWTIDNRTLILRRGAKTVTLFPTAIVAQRCGATKMTVTAAGTTHRYPVGALPRALTVKAPADIDSGAIGPCRAAVAITLAPAHKPLAWITPHRYGHWRVTQPGAYQFTFTIHVCTLAHNECTLGLQPLRVGVRVNP